MAELSTSTWVLEAARSGPVQMVGKSSQYAFATQDKAGNYLDGAKTYRLHLPPDIPVKDFWSILVYDPQTRSMLQTDQQFPSTQQPERRLDRQSRHVRWISTSAQHLPHGQGSQLGADHPR